MEARILSNFIHMRLVGFAFLFSTAFATLLILPYPGTVLAEDCPGLVNIKVMLSGGSQQGDQYCWNISGSGALSHMCNPEVPSLCPCLAQGCGVTWDEPSGGCISQDPNYAHYHRHQEGCRRGVQYCKCDRGVRYCADCDCVIDMDCQSYYDPVNCRRYECIGFHSLGMSGGQGPIASSGGFKIECPVHNVKFKFCSEIDSSYLPQYNDELCFSFTTDKIETLEVVLKMSTFEGIAMNAAVPAGVDTISDMLPQDTSTVLNETSWKVDRRWYQNDRSCIKLRRILKPVRPSPTPSNASAFLYVTVLDYAAELELDARLASDSTVEFASDVVIPFILDSLRSTSDADEDGFTKWEEYRGFFNVNQALDSFHTRLAYDSLIPELFYRDDGSMEDELIELLQSNSLTNSRFIKFGPGIGSYTYPILGDDLEYEVDRYFIDFKSRMIADSEIVPNPLCTPAGLEYYPLTWEQNPDTIYIADIALVLVDFNPYGGADSTEIGETYQCQYGEVLDSCIQRWLYPGPGGCGGITIYEDSCEALANEIIDDYSNYYHCPIGLRSELHDWWTWRTVAHEFGHMQGVDHHCDDTIQYNNGNYEYVWVSTHGNPRCVMKYNTPDDFPTVEAQWYDSIGMDGHRIGVILDDAYGCFTERANRP